MMESAIFDDSEFPDVYVTPISLNTKSEFNDMCHKWMKLYERGEKFNLFFDTKHLKRVSITTVFSFPRFIKNTRTLIQKYLNKTVINIYDSKLLYLIKVAFAIQRPYAPVYVTLCPPNEETNEVKLFGFTNFIHEKIFKYEHKTYLFKPR